MLPPWLANGIVALVSLVWVINFGARFVVEDYVPSPTVDGAFMTIVGGALMLKARRGNNAREEEES